MKILVDPASILLRLCREHTGKSVDPTDAAKAVAEAEGGDSLAWRGHLQTVRRAAVKLAKDGRLVILRKGKPADPEDFRGVYRIGLPSSD